MIKKINLLLAGAVCCCVAVLSCSKSNEADLSNPGNGNGGTGTTCDTVNMQYTANVLPIIRSNCYGCHGNGAASGGVSLDSYDKLRTQAASGKLLAVITHAAGVPPMPQGGKLSECDINKIRSWINRGILNN